MFLRDGILKVLMSEHREMGLAGPGRLSAGPKTTHMEFWESLV